MKFCQFVEGLYPHILTSFGRVTLIFNKMVLIFLGVLIIFTGSSFEFNHLRLPLTSLLMISGPNSSHLNPQVATVLTCTSVNLVYLTGESH